MRRVPEDDALLRIAQGFAGAIRQSIPLARSAAAVALGFKQLDPGGRMAEAILNNVSGGRHRRKATEAVERLAKVPVLGAVERGSPLPERHLMLVPAEEQGDLKALRAGLRP